MRRLKMRWLVHTLSVVLAVIYPLGVFWALLHWSARSVALFALALLIPTMVLRYRRAPGRQLWPALRVPLVIGALLTAGAALDDARLVLALPVLISLSLLVLFGLSLRGTSTVETFARLQEPELSPAKVAHCRQATFAWCVFFVINAAIAGGLALSDWREAWAVYNGGVAYALMGLLALGEFVVRRVRFREYGRGPWDRILSALFPPRTNGPPAQGGLP